MAYTFYFYFFKIIISDYLYYYTPVSNYGAHFSSYYARIWLSDNNFLKGKKENMSRSRVLFIGCERRIIYLWLTILFHFILRPTFIELSLIFINFKVKQVHKKVWKLQLQFMLYFCQVKKHLKTDFSQLFVYRILYVLELILKTNIKNYY